MKIRVTVIECEAAAGFPDDFYAQILGLAAPKPEPAEKPPAKYDVEVASPLESDELETPAKWVAAVADCLPVGDPSFPAAADVVLRTLERYTTPIAETKLAAALRLSARGIGTIRGHVSRKRDKQNGFPLWKLLDVGCNRHGTWTWALTPAFREFRKREG